MNENALKDQVESLCSLLRHFYGHIKIATSMETAFTLAGQSIRRTSFLVVLLTYMLVHGKDDLHLRPYHILHVHNYLTEIRQ